MGHHVQIIWHLAAHAARGSIKTTYIPYFDYSFNLHYFRFLETVPVLYQLITWVLCYNAHITCLHSNTCDRLDMTEPLNKNASRFQITCTVHTMSHHVTRLNIAFADLIATCNKSSMYTTMHYHMNYLLIHVYPRAYNRENIEHRSMLCIM